MLYEFITTYRDQVIAKTREKVSTRPSPPASTSELEHGVPMFLAQLVETLQWESLDALVVDGDPQSPEHRARRRHNLIVQRQLRFTRTCGPQSPRASA